MLQSTTDIKTLLLQQYDGFLQESWDEYLVNNWPSTKIMGRIVDDFCEKMKIPREKVFSLKRSPKIGVHLKCGLSRFIAAYLPSVNTSLWSDSTTKEKILRLLKGSPLDTLIYPSDNQKVIREHNERSVSRRKYLAAEANVVLKADWRSATSRSNWNACK